MMSFKRVPLHALILLVCAALVIALTTLPTSVRLIGIVRRLIVVEGHPNLSDAIGHAALYALLTGVIYWALRSRVGFGWALAIALGASLVAGAATEFLQQYSPGRAMVLSDLLANWLGAMTVALLISFRRSSRSP